MSGFHVPFNFGKYPLGQFHFFGGNVHTAHLPENQTPAFAFGLTFAEQSEFFRWKLNLPSQAWDDIWKSQHDRAFIVAGAMKADLLSDLHAAVQKAIDGGTTLETFRKDFRQIVAKNGWHGWTGEGTKAGEAWRTQIIYETNLRTSYAAGRYAQLTDPELLKRCPYWKYIHDDGVKNPRMEHVAWDGLTLRHDHPFWETHYPPNGWGCCCRVVAVPELEEGAKTEPPEGWDKINKKTGEQAGIGKGWGYAPGKSVAEGLRQAVENKIGTMEASLGADMWQSFSHLMGEPLRQNAADFVRETAKTMRHRGEEALMHIVSPLIVSKMESIGKSMATSGLWLTDEVLLHGIREAKAGRGTALPLSTWENLPALLDTAEVYLDAQDNRLLFVFDGGKTPEGKLSKVAVAVNYVEKARLAGTKDRRRKTISNYIRTGGFVDAENITEDIRYVQISEK